MLSCHGCTHIRVKPTLLGLLDDFWTGERGFWFLVNMFSSCSNLVTYTFHTIKALRIDTGQVYS